MSENINKKVDEGWKEKVEKEKAGAPKEGYRVPQEVTFATFISGLGLQSLVMLGEVENPVTKKKETKLDEARYIIDTLDMLKEKTKNNLQTNESKLLENLLYDLKMRYAEKNKERM